MNDQEYEKIRSNYSRPIIDSSMLKIRLDTTELLEKIEFYLKGSREIITKNDQGEIVTTIVKNGFPKANEQGVQGLLNWISATINPQVVQGNFPETSSGDSPAYNRYIKEYHIELTELIIRNIYTWGILENEINGVISFILLLVQPFFSRLIGNKERESYSQSLRGEERTVSDGKKKWGVFG